MSPNPHCSSATFLHMSSTAFWKLPSHRSVLQLCLLLPASSSRPPLGLHPASEHRSGGLSRKSLQQMYHLLVHGRGDYRMGTAQQGPQGHSALVAGLEPGHHPHPSGRCLRTGHSVPKCACTHVTSTLVTKPSPQLYPASEPFPGLHKASVVPQAWAARAQVPINTYFLGGFVLQQAHGQLW